MAKLGVEGVGRSGNLRLHVGDLIRHQLDIFGRLVGQGDSGTRPKRHRPEAVQDVGRIDHDRQGVHRRESAMPYGKEIRHRCLHRRAARPSRRLRHPRRSNPGVCPPRRDQAEHLRRQPPCFKPQPEGSRPNPNPNPARPAAARFVWAGSSAACGNGEGPLPIVNGVQPALACHALPRALQGPRV